MSSPDRRRRAGAPAASVSLAPSIANLQQAVADLAYQLEQSNAHARESERRLAELAERQDRQHAENRERVTALTERVDTVIARVEGLCSHVEASVLAGDVYAAQAVRELGALILVVHQNAGLLAQLVAAHAPAAGEGGAAIVLLPRPERGAA